MSPVQAAREAGYPVLFSEEGSYLIRVSGEGLLEVKAWVWLALVATLVLAVISLVVYMSCALLRGLLNASDPEYVSKTECQPKETGRLCGADRIHVVMLVIIAFCVCTKLLTGCEQLSWTVPEESDSPSQSGSVPASAMPQ